MTSETIPTYDDLVTKDRIILGVDPEGAPVYLPARNEDGKSQAWQKIAFIGVSGSGKSYAAGIMVEEWIRNDIPIVILDPVGIWWGLRAGADGTAEGGLPIAVYGGMHGDQELPDPIDAAEMFALDGMSMVLDISEIPMDALHHYAATFAEELMAPGRIPAQPSHIVVEEAPVLIPQSGSLSNGQKPCKAALAHLARVGRNRGYGMTIITQRAAAVDKNVLTQCDTLLLLRIAANIDRKVIREWIAENAATDEIKLEMLEEMGMTPNGEGWLWSPRWAQTFTKVFIRQRVTFHPGPDSMAAELIPLKRGFNSDFLLKWIPKILVGLYIVLVTAAKLILGVVVIILALQALGYILAILLFFAFWKMAIGKSK